MSARGADVVVLGGGLVGCWAAFWLRRRGRSVIVVERERVGAQASGVNFGSLRIQGRVLSQLPLSLLAQQIWEDLPALIGEDCEVTRTGHLHVALDAAQMDKVVAWSRAALGYGLETEVLDAAQVRRRFAWLAPKLVGATYSPRDGAANPRLCTPALARALRAAGGEIIEDAGEVVAHGAAGAFELALPDGRRVRGGALVNAAGAWGGAVAAGFGEAVPQFAAGPTDMVTEPVPHFILPTVQAVDGSIVVRQIERGNVVIAGHPRGPVDPVGRTGRVPARKMLQNMARLADLIPALASVRVIRAWTGIEGYFPDMLPVIGPSHTQAGLVHGFGLCGNGFQIAPAVGKVLSELVVDGCSETPIAPFDIGRFAAPAASPVDLHEEFDQNVLRRVTADQSSGPHV